MYSEKSVGLKSDFYSRYGETLGELYFERTGVPCVLLASDTHMLAFSLGCGVRAYGRKYGDVLKVMSADSDICDVRFVNNGRGAQILYSADIPELRGVRETTVYTLEKLLRRMNAMTGYSSGIAAMCDQYGSGGWCAYSAYDEVKSVPLPLQDYNVIIIRTNKSHRIRAAADLLERFNSAETKRIAAAADALHRCREDVLFSMMNESLRSMQHLFSLPSAAVYAADIALATDGVKAVRISEQGVICIIDKNATNAAAKMISNEFSYNVGCSAGIMVVK